MNSSRGPPIGITDLEDAMGGAFFPPLRGRSANRIDANNTAKIAKRGTMLGKEDECS